MSDHPGTDRSTASGAIACNLGALTPRERERRAHLAGRLISAIERAEELPDGYLLVLSPTNVSLEETAELVSLERRCCEFLRIDSLNARPDSQIELKIAGSPGVKPFLEAAFAIKK